MKVLVWESFFSAIFVTYTFGAMIPSELDESPNDPTEASTHLSSNSEAPITLKTRSFKLASDVFQQPSGSDLKTDNAGMAKKDEPLPLIRKTGGGSVVKSLCGPIPFPELSCEEPEVNPLPPWEHISSKQPQVYISSPHPTYTRKQGNRFARTKTIDDSGTLSRRISSYLTFRTRSHMTRNSRIMIKRIREPFKRPRGNNIRYRQFLKDVIPTSSTKPYGRAVNKDLTGCNSFAKCSSVSNKLSSP